MPKAPSMSAAEWAVREDLAACYPLVAYFGMDDVIGTHVSAQCPAAPVISSSIPAV